MIDPFPLLLAGHALGDWVIQSDWEAAHKSWPPRDYEAELSRARSIVGLDDNHPDPIADQTRSARSYLRRQSWKANQAHVATYHLTIAAFLLLSPNLLMSRLLPALAFSWMVHSLIDRRWPVRWILEHTGSRAFAATPLGILAADQAIHVATLALMTAWLVR